MAKKIGNQSGLEAFLASIEHEALQPGEWTAMQAHEKTGGRVTLAAIRNRLMRDESNGELTSRRVLLNGTWTRAYRQKS